MDKTNFIAMLIEAVIFIIPIITLFIKLGGYKELLEETAKKCDNLPEWKATITEKVCQLEINDVEQNKTLVDINKNLIEISTKMSLLLDNKIKTETK